MLCFSSTDLSFPGTLYFVGFLVGSLIWLRVADLIGRKVLIIGGILLHCLAQLLYIINLSYASVLISFSILGFKAAITNLIAYLLMI